MNKSVMIGTPMYGGMCSYAYTAALASNLIDLKSHDINVGWCFVYNDSLVTRARNYIANHFLNSNCTHLMFIDGDIQFPDNSIRQLLNVEKNFVCAPYPKKIVDWSNIKRNLNFAKTEEDIKKLGSSYVLTYLDSNDIPIPDENNLIEVKQSGTGFMLITKKVVERLEAKLPKTRGSNFGNLSNWYVEFFKTDIDENGIFQSEDWYFCNQWKKLDEKIFLKLDINLNHIGSYVYEGNILQFGANLT